MIKILKYLSVIFVGIILLLAITNPSTKHFKEFIGVTRLKYFDLTFKRTHNYLIFSTYKFDYNGSDMDYYENKHIYLIKNKEAELEELKGNYIGLFANFFKKD